MEVTGQGVSSPFPSFRSSTSRIVLTAALGHALLFSILLWGSLSDPSDDFPAPSSRVLLLANATLSSHVNSLLALNVGAAVLILVSVFLKEIALGELTSQELHKLIERAEILLWTGWYIVSGFLKAYGGMAKDRFETLGNASTERIGDRARAMALLVFVSGCSLAMAVAAMESVRGAGWHNALILITEPVLVLVDGLHTLFRYAMHIHESRIRSKSTATGESGEDVESSPVDREWYLGLIKATEFGCETSCLVLTLAHVLHVWWLHGFKFHIIDAVLFLNVKLLVRALYKRVHRFVKYQRTLFTLRQKFLDATPEQLADYADDCAICRDSMAKGRRLPCGHTFHLVCLERWLDQGRGNVFSCPICRKPLELSSEGPSQTTEAPSEVHNTNENNNNTTERTRDERAEVIVNPTRHWMLPLVSGFRRRNGNNNNNSNQAGIGGAQQGPPTGTEPQRNLLSRTFQYSAVLGVETWNHAHRRSQQTRPGRSSVMDGMVIRVQEVLPHVDRGVIVNDLIRTRDPAATVNNLLDHA